jgi:hypothetical protein
METLDNLILGSFEDQYYDVLQTNKHKLGKRKRAYVCKVQTRVKLLQESLSYSEFMKRFQLCLPEKDQKDIKNNTLVVLTKHIQFLRRKVVPLSDGKSSDSDEETRSDIYDWITTTPQEWRMSLTSRKDTPCMHKLVPSELLLFQIQWNLQVDHLELFRHFMLLSYQCEVSCQ